MRELSELEGCVLGLIWKHGPTTAYAVRKELLASPSSHWSASAGAIYPLLERMHKRRLVAAKAGARGDRSHTSYELTNAGVSALSAWLSPTLEYDIISVAPDPLRTRLYFLRALPAARRNTFLKKARAKLAEYLREIENAPTGDEFDELANRGALRATEARIAWLDDVQQALARKQRVRKK
jgi:DNA-binding PadR family transcriptional regulator